MIFKNINSEDIPGLIICSEPPISGSSIKIKEISIDGRDGTIIEELGYKAYNKNVEIGLKKDADINAILKYFSGKGDLTFENENDKVYKAAVYEQINLEKLLRLRKGTVTFYCQPFKYIKNDTYKTFIDKVTNDGNIESKPIIRLEKETSETVDLTIGKIRFKYKFNANDTYVEIDCEEMNALYEGLNRNRNLEIGYEFPKLYPGNNSIVVNSGDVTVKLKRKDRWL